MCRKVYVDVLLRQEKNGKITPLAITWENGEVYEVDKVTHVCKATSLKAGGAGLRFTCRIGRRESYLFLEGDRWFVEGKG